MKCLIYALLFFFQVNAEDIPEEVKNVINFDDLDSDSNGDLSLEEVQTWYTENRPKISKADVKAIFKSYDSNLDGNLTVSEFVPLAFALSQKPANQSEDLFKRIDLNNDGKLTRSEAEKAEAEVPAQFIEGIFQIADTNRDGIITYKEFSAVIDSYEQPKTQEEQDRETAAQLLALMDQNGDKKVNVQEAHAFANLNTNVSEADVIKAFKYLDSDGDGWIDADELKHLPDKMAALVRYEVPPMVLQ